MMALNNSPVIFWRPAAISVALHALLVLALTMNWLDHTDTTLATPKAPPRYVEARLIDVEALKPKPKPRTVKPKPKPVAPKPKTVTPKPKPVPAKPKPKPVQPAVKPEPKPEPVDTPSPEELAEQARAELAVAMAEKDEWLAEASDEQLAQSFIALISQTVQNNWSRPPSARNGMEAELVLQLIPTGEVVSVTVARSSGQLAFDRSAVNAVQKAERFPELQQLPSRVFERNFRQFRLLFKPEDLRF